VETEAILHVLSTGFRTKSQQTSENVTKLKYFGATLTYQNFIHEEIYSRLNSVNACYSVVHGLLSHTFSIQRHEIKTYRSIIWPVV